MHIRNKHLREKYIRVVEDNGLKFNWISKQIDIPISTLSNWKQGRANMSIEKLDRVERFLLRYDYLDTYEGE